MCQKFLFKICKIQKIKDCENLELLHRFSTVSSEKQLTVYEMLVVFKDGCM